MADEVVATIKQYWAVISTVVATMFALGWFMYTITASMNNELSEIKSDLREVRAVVSDNLGRLNEFARQGERYTLRDHSEYAAEKAEKDAEQDREIQSRNAEQDRRLTVIEETLKRINDRNRP